MIYPKPLKPGDTVGIAAPSGPLTDRGRENIADFMKILNLNPVYGKSISGSAGYLSADDCIRAYDIENFFSDSSIDAVFAARGGYGSQRIIPMLNKEIFINNPKIFTGFSDITALHSFYNNLGLATFHAPMPGTDNLDKIDKLTIESFKASIFGHFQGALPYEAANPPLILVPGKCRGILAGGNLALLASSIGTEYELDFTGKIIFIEEVAEQPYSIDRLLCQLFNHGSLEKAAGFILGSFTRCEPENGRPPFYLDVIKEYFTKLNKPCIYNIPCGHQFPNITLPFGREALIHGNTINIL